VVIDGASLTGNYHTQFSSIILDLTYAGVGETDERENTCGQSVSNNYGSLVA